MTNPSIPKNGEPPALVPDGEYELAFMEHHTFYAFTKPRLVLWFRVLTPGYWEAVLPAYYQVRDLLNRPGRSGHFVTKGHSSKLVRDFIRLFGRVDRLDRLPMTRFKDVIFLSKTTIVSKGSDQHSIPDDLKYGVIERLILVVEGNHV